MNKQDRSAAHGRFCDDLDELLDEIRNELVDKNRKYGDSALSPANVFSKATSIEQIKVRLDDKLARKVSDQLDEDEDIDKDILGYLVLLRIARKREDGMPVDAKEDSRKECTELTVKGRTVVHDKNMYTSFLGATRT